MAESSAAAATTIRDPWRRRAQEVEPVGMNERRERPTAPIMVSNPVFRHQRQCAGQPKPEAGRAAVRFSKRMQIGPAPKSGQGDRAAADRDYI